MIYSLKLLFATLVTGGIGAYLFSRAFDGLLSREDYRRAWTCIALVTVVVFLSKFPAAFCLGIALIAAFQASAMRSGVIGNLSVFMLLAPVLPPIEFSLGGVGEIGYVISFNHFRVLTLALLITPALKLIYEKGVRKRRGFIWVDLAVLGYQVLRIALLAPSSTTTTLARAVVMSMLDVWVPYYVVTRGIRTLSELRFVISHLMIGLTFVACTGVLEFVTQRNVYSALQEFYGISWQLTYVLLRGGLVRVQATAQVPINLAIMMTVAIGLWIWLRGVEWRQRPVILLFATLLMTLAATWSRGPWLAAGVMCLVVALLSRMPPGTFRILLLIAATLGIGAEVTGADGAVIAFLGALFGNSQGDLLTIDYRRQLLSMSLALVKQSPWLGVPNYAAQLQSLRQGEGIIDLVNSYVGIMLDVGITGLLVYVTPFVIVIHRLLNAIRRNTGGKLEAGSRFAVAMVAVILALLFAIFTTSTFGILPLLLTMSIALPLAWLAMPEDARYSMDPQPYRSGRLARGHQAHPLVPAQHTLR